MVMTLALRLPLYLETKWHASLYQLLFCKDISQPQELHHY